MNRACRDGIIPAWPLFSTRARARVPVANRLRASRGRARPSPFREEAPGEAGSLRTPFCLGGVAVKRERLEEAVGWWEVELPSLP